MSQITRDLMQEKYGYPRWLNLFALWMIVINPLTKFGLCSRPVSSGVSALYLRKTAFS
jgi:vesicular inhibitory amino acid transporter